MTTTTDVRRTTGGTTSTDTTADAAPGAATSGTSTDDVRLPRTRFVRSEWIKLRSLRSTVYSLAAAFVAIVAIGTFMSLGAVLADSSEGEPVGPLAGALAGIGLSELIVAVLGVLAVTGEYASGLVRVTFAAVPRRTSVLVAKAVTVGATVFVVTLAAALVTFFAAGAVVARTGASLSQTAPGVVRALVGAALYLAGIALLGMGFGWLLRSTAGAMAALVGMLYVLPVVGMVLPAEVGARILPYLPNNAGTAIMQIPPAGPLGAWGGFALFAGYVAMILAAAAVAVRRRDA